MRFQTSRPKFCVVTPTIPGRARLLRAAIQSVKAQTFKDYVHVVCSDGENPESEAVAKEEGVVWECIPKAAGWGYGARNHILHNYDGDYFMFLDDDNAYKPNCMEEIAKETPGNPPFIAIQVDWIARWMKPPQRWVIPNEPKIEKGFWDQMNHIVRSDIAKQVDFEAVYENDFAYAVKCFDLAGRKMVFIRKVLAVYSWSWEEDNGFKK